MNFTHSRNVIRKHAEDESEEETKRTRNVSLRDLYISVYVVYYTACMYFSEQFLV